MKHALPFFLLFAFTAACGPSPEVIATQTATAATAIAEAWTKTPTAAATSSPAPTVTPTHISTPTPTQTPTPTIIPTPIGGGSGKIIFVRREFLASGHNDTLRSMTLDGSASVELISKAQVAGQLQQASVHSISLLPSLDGKMVVIYVCGELVNDRCGQLDTYVASLDLTAFVPIEASGAVFVEWAWSPDSTKLLGVAYKQKGNISTIVRSAVYVVSSDGSGLKLLTESGQRDSQPFWSFDGSQMYWFNADAGLRVMNADGSNRHQVKGMENSYGTLLQFSPNGEKIAFATYIKGKPHLVVANSDFSNQAPFSLPKGYSIQSITWSPNGEYVLLGGSICDDSGGCVSGAPEIIMRTDTGEQISLRVPGNDIQGLCGWTPDNKFVYRSYDYLELVDLSQLDSPDSRHRISFRGECPIWLP